MATPSYNRLPPYATMKTHLSPVHSPPPSRPPSTPVPPLPQTMSTISLPRLYPPRGAASKHFSSMVDLSSEAKRNTTIDPRRARRHGTDFGFSRPPPLSLPCPTISLNAEVNPSPSDSLPTPGSTFSSGSEDSDASSLQDLRFDFPEPPPISPVLRRMKSSPLFTMDDASALELGQRTLTAVSPDKSLGTFDAFAVPYPEPRSKFLPVSETNSTNSPDSISQYSDSDTHGEQLILDSTRRLLRPLADLPSPDSSMMNDPKEQSFRVLPSPSHDTPFPTNVPPSSSTPSLPSPTPTRRVSKMRSLKFSPSTEKLFTRSDKPKPPKSMVRGRSVSMDFKSLHSGFFASTSDRTVPRPRPGQAQLSPYPVYATPTKKSSVAAPSGHSKSFSLQHATRPPGSFSSPHKPTIRPLSTSVGHQKGVSVNLGKGGELKSFMDISPERQGRRIGNGKDKVKKLLARASTMFEWGKLKKVGKQ